MESTGFYAHTFTPQTAFPTVCVSKMSGYLTGEFNAMEVKAQGADATSDLLAEVEVNPEFAGFVPVHATAILV